MGYKTFEDLQAYQLAREFRKEIFELIKLLPVLSPVCESLKSRPIA